jgi:hypothetical protein
MVDALRLQGATARTDQGQPSATPPHQPVVRAMDSEEKRESNAPREPRPSAASPDVPILPFGSQQITAQTLQTPLWRGWTLAGLASATVTQIVFVLALALTEHNLHHGIGWAIGQITYTWLFWPMGAISGIATGITQDVLLGRHLKKIRGWSLVTAAGSFIGWAVAAFAILAGRGLLSYPEGIIPWAIMWVLFGAFRHSAMGSGQWILMRKAKLAVRWIQTSALGGMLGGLVGGSLAWGIFAAGGADTENMPICLAAGAVGNIVAGTITEAITGLTLVQVDGQDSPTHHI